MMDRVTKGFFDRMKKIQAMRMLGTGMDIGDIQEYVHEICFLLLLKVFRREITENPDRTRADLIFLSQESMRELGLYPDRGIAERITDGVLWYRDPARQEPFYTKIFNEDTGTHEEFKFKYLKDDREHSQWESGGPTVYMLTEVAQEIIFITREILEEFGFDIEQFYTLQLIKSGNFNKAEGSIDNLIARVRTLIRREKDYREDIIRNPQVIFFDGRRNRQKSEEEIKRQFEEEQKVFNDMFSWKSRLDTFPEAQRAEAITMFDNLERARMLHNELAKMVVENMALEVEMRVKYPERFWRISSLSFKKDIWQNVIVKHGLPDFELLEDIIAPLFSPEMPFIFPLDWSWEAQRTIAGKRMEEDENVEDAEPEETWEEKGVDWELITQLYEGVFDSLLVKGSFNVSSLKDISEQDKIEWLYQKENIDMLMMLVITELQLTTKYDLAVGVDERLELFARLCNKNERFKQLEGRIISSYIEEGKENLEWEEVILSPYVIYLKE
jgi:hypothetical protein